MSLINWVTFPPLGDERGSLVALEEVRSVPFYIKRLYYIFGTKDGVIRGLHAHKALKQVMLCVTGCCRVKLDDGTSSESVCLNSPIKGLYVEGPIWREMYDFSPDCVLLVIASEYYDEDDYIRNYNDFIKLAENV